MVDVGYLEKGLIGLSRAHRVNAMAGHLGAALVAGFLFSSEHDDLEPEVHSGLQSELDRVLRGESVFGPAAGDPITVGDLFEPLPEEPRQEGEISRIAQSLSKSIAKMRQSGHNVIFAALAIRAMLEFPEYAMRPVIEGICSLTDSFDDASPGSGYYGKELGRINGNDLDLTGEQDVPPYTDLRAMVSATLDELIETAAERRQGFGGLWHLVNHAAALVDLADLGFEDLAQQGLDAHRHHLRLWRSLPSLEDELRADPPAEHDPLTAAYWSSGGLRRDRARLTHRVKTLYGFYRLVDLVEDSARVEVAKKKLLYLM